MRLTRIPREFREAVPIIHTIKEAGYEAYFVGGSVRDVLLGKSIHDVDIATSAFPSEIKALFSRTIDVGIQHGTVMVVAPNRKTYEITTFRTESAYQDFRRPDHVEFVRSLEEDLKRRDFTINAFALEEDGEIIDLFEGLDDLSNKVLRAVGNPHERFHEDALRMMRGFRLMSQLGFTLEEDTFAAVLENHALLEKISVERINAEFVKMLLGENRSESLDAFVKTECYQYCPGLKNSGEALLEFADLPDYTIPSEEQAWTLLIVMLQLEQKIIPKFLREWKCSNRMIREVRSLVKGLRFRMENSWTNQMLYQLGRESIQKIEELLPYFEKENEAYSALSIYQKLPIHRMQDLAISGTDLLEQISPKGGKWLSELLADCEDAVLNGEVPNDFAVLMDYAKEHYVE